MATAPVPGAAARAAAANTSMRITIDGVAYVFRPGDVTGLMTGELRKQSGMSMQAVMKAATDDPDLDVIAAIVWVARQQAGEAAVTYAEVAGGMSYLSAIEVTTDVIEVDEVDSPEA